MRKACLISIVAFCFISTVTQATPRSSREGDGVIKSVNWDNRTFTIRMEETSQLRIFEWDGNTEFYEGLAATTARDLKPGKVLHIRYHVPFFGKPFVCKVRFVGRPKATHPHRSKFNSAFPCLGSPGFAA